MHRGAPILFVLVAALLACGGPAAPPPAAPPPSTPAAPPAPPPPPVVWTARPGVTLHTAGAAVPLPRPFTRLDVVAADSVGLSVRCAVCPGAPTGHVDPADVVSGPAAAPAVASRDSLARFALAVRAAATSHDLVLLRQLMDPSFTYAFIGPPGAEQAIAAWGWERYRPLDAVPALLDQGLTRQDDDLWVAPPAYAESPTYRGPRLGFHRGRDGVWRWVFLIESR